MPTIRTKKKTKYDVCEMHRWPPHLLSKYNLDCSRFDNLDKESAGLWKRWISSGCCFGKISSQAKWRCMENSPRLMPSCTSLNWHQAIHPIWHQASWETAWDICCFWSSSSGNAILQFIFSTFWCNSVESFVWVCRYCNSRLVYVSKSLFPLCFQSLILILEFSG